MSEHKLNKLYKCDKITEKSAQSIPNMEFFPVYCMLMRNRSLSHTKLVHFHRPKIPTICYLVRSFVLVGSLNFTQIRIGILHFILSSPFF